MQIRPRDTTQYGRRNVLAIPHSMVVATTPPHRRRRDTSTLYRRRRDTSTFHK
jgi:hypothetical protein